MAGTVPATLTTTAGTVSRGVSVKFVPTTVVGAVAFQSMASVRMNACCPHSIPLAKTNVTYVSARAPLN